MSNQNLLCYFAADGNCGDAKDFVVVDVLAWTPEDWERVENASNSERAAVAKSIGPEAF